MRQCVKCKKPFVPGSKRSFHSLPKKIETREKWISILQLPNIYMTKKAFICNDHFTKESFFEEDEGKSRRRLHFDALPCLSKTTVKEIEKSTEDLTNSIDTFENESNDHIEVIFETATNFHGDSSCNDDLCESNKMKLSDQSGTIINSKNLFKSQSKDCIQVISESSTNSHDSSCDDNLCESNKRKLSDQSEKITKNIKCMKDDEVEYMCRSDFISEEAWNKFLRFKAVQEKRITTAYNEKSRHIIKINNLINAITQRCKMQQN